jgi:hypothetical protein
MKIITIELLNDEALKLIKHLEILKILRLVNENKQTNTTKRRWAGSLSKETASKMINHVNESRNEWERNS